MGDIWRQGSGGYLENESKQRVRGTVLLEEREKYREGAKNAVVGKANNRNNLWKKEKRKTKDECDGREGQQQKQPLEEVEEEDQGRNGWRQWKHIQKRWA